MLNNNIFNNNNGSFEVLARFSDNQSLLSTSDSETVKLRSKIFLHNSGHNQI